jgi:4-amino-4-deoxy-L-arabinose transferase-like glycosyltransferase
VRVGSCQVRPELPFSRQCETEIDRPTVDRGTSPRTRHALLLILLLGLALRSLYFFAPFVDGHSFRQIDTAAIARNFYEGSFIPFDPQIDWGGAHGYVEAEFPAIPALATLLYHAAGLHEWLGRVVVIPFALGLIWAAYRLVRSLDGSASAGLAAAFLVAISPSAAFFGRVLMPDTPMLFLSTLALIGFVEFAKSGSGRSLALGGISLGAACLIKLPAIFVAPAIAVVVLQGRGWAVFRDRRAWLAVALPLLVALAWYLHARQVFHTTGLTFGVSGGASKMYPAWISPGPWTAVFNKWSTAELLSDPGFYDEMFRRFYYLHWTPVGFALGLLGTFLMERRARWVMLAWFASMTVFVLAMGEVHWGHEYYQLPFVVIAAVPFGAAAWPAFDSEWIARRIGPGALRQAVVWLVVAASGCAGFYQSGVLRNFYEPHGMADRTRVNGLHMNAATRDNTLAIVVDDYGITSPMLLYFAHLKGWSFDPTDLSPELVSHLRDMGARYFATTRYREIEQERPEVTRFLADFESVPIEGASADVQLFDLFRRRVSQ